MINKSAFVGWIVAGAFMATAGLAWALAGTPSDVDLTADVDSITVSWQAGMGADGHYVYWGTEFDNLENQANISNSADESYVIEDLESKTVYYVAVSAYDDDGESRRSAVQSIETLENTSTPTVPQGLQIPDLNQITETSLVLQWDANDETDLDFYRIIYDTEAGGNQSSQDVDAGTETRASITDLESSTRYFFTVTAVNEDGNQSDPSPKLWADTLPDQLAPFAPEKIEARLSDPQQVTVTISRSNEQMADLAGHRIWYGRQPGSLERVVDIKDNKSFVIPDLPDNTTWYFAAAAYDRFGNESNLSDRVSVDVEETTGYLESSGDFGGGCFVSSLFRDRENKDHVSRNRKNKTGVSAGWLVPAESEFKDYYGDDTFPVFVFYDRMLGRHFSVSARAGYMEESGYMQTVSGQSTGLKTTFTAVPVSASLNWNFPVAKNVTGFLGAGPDYWYCKEEFDDLSGKDISKWVGGYHGRTGLWLHNEDPDYSSWGAVMECGYYQIDKLGSNSVNPGGWIFSLGFFYGF